MFCKPSLFDEKKILAQGLNLVTNGKTDYKPIKRKRRCGRNILCLIAKTSLNGR